MWGDYMFKFIKNMFKIFIIFISICFIVVIAFLILIRINTRIYLNEKVKIINEDSREMDAISEIEKALSFEYDWNKLFLTDNFKRKFKNRYGIIKTFLVLSNPFVMKYNDPEKHNIVEVEFDIIEPFDLNISIICYFEYFLDNSGFVDDIELLTKYYVDSATLVRIDDIVPATYDNIENLLLYMADGTHNFDNGINAPHYTDKNLPLSKNCKIINRPNVMVIGHPKKSYYKKENEKEYIILEYDDKDNIIYEVNYTIDKDFNFEYIVFIKIN